jgi:hypothetical protein
MRVNTQIDDVKKNIATQDDFIWKEIRNCQANCKEYHKMCEVTNNDKIEKAIKDVKKDIKLWIAFSILSAIGAVMFSIVSRLIQGAIK